MLIHTDKGNFGSPSFGPSEKWVLNTYTLTLPTDISRVSFYTYPSTGSNLNYTDYMAAKLEPGPVQTLAHKDAAGDWVLNDPPPDPVFEQLKCQRYQVFGPVESAHLTHAGNISIAILPLPARLRSMPTIVGNPTVWAVDGNAEIKNVTITPDYVLNNGILLRITGSEVPCYVSFKAGDGLDANL